MTSLSDTLPDDVHALLDPLDDRRKHGCVVLIAAMQQATAMPPRVWPGGIVGCGSYRYRYESGREGESCALGFAARAREFVLYVHADAIPPDLHATLTAALGRVRQGKGCLYLTDPAAVPPEALAALLAAGVRALAASPTTTSLVLGPGSQATVKV